MICAFCPAVACEGLTVIAACETHWDNPEGEATRLESENRDLRARLAALEAVRQAADALIDALVESSESGSDLCAQCWREIDADTELATYRAATARLDGVGED